MSLQVGWFSRAVRWIALPSVLFFTLSSYGQWKAAVGAQSDNKAKQALAFLPNEMWIHQGDNITWHFEAGEIHTVTFLSTIPSPQIRPPFAVGCPGFSSDPAMFDGTTCVSTPPLVEGSTFTVSFPATGNFKLVCLVHPDMTALVHVLDGSTPLPHTQEYYNQEARNQALTLLSQPESPAAHHANHVTAGNGAIISRDGGAQTLSVMGFTHGIMVVHAGQTVEWENEDPEDPHTITFGTEPPDVFDPSPNVTVDDDGARHAVLNAPSDSVHSGFLLAGPQERTGLPQLPPFVTKFRITFTHPGTYPYLCALHDNLGMKGVIIVIP